MFPNDSNQPKAQRSSKEADVSDGEQSAKEQADVPNPNIDLSIVEELQTIINQSIEVNE